jgi:hypothetical protein
MIAGMNFKSSQQTRGPSLPAWQAGNFQLWVEETSHIQGTTGKNNGFRPLAASDVQRRKNMLCRGRRSDWNDTADLLARAGMEVLVLEKRAHLLRMSP